MSLILGSGISPWIVATHSGILTWRSPRTDKPDRLQVMGLQESDMTEQLSTRTHVRSQLHSHSCGTDMSATAGSRNCLIEHGLSRSCCYEFPSGDLRQPFPVLLSGLSFQGPQDLRVSEVCLSALRLGLKRPIHLCRLMQGFSSGASGKEHACQCRRHRDVCSIPGLGRSPGIGNGHTLQPAFIPGKSLRQRSLGGYSP